MFPRVHQLALALVALPLIAATNSDFNQVTEIRFFTFPEATRIILRTTDPVEYKADRAINPDRLFFDLIDTKPFIAGKRSYSYNIADSLVDRVRIAETVPGTTRVVFDLHQPVTYTVTTLEGPDRMVIELKPAKPAAPAPPVKTPKAFTAPPVAESPLTRRIAVPVPPSFPIAMPELTLALMGEPVIFIPSSPVSAPAPATSVKVMPAVSHSNAAPVTALASQNASRSLTRALGLKINRIVIDAGHGGHDEGTSGPHRVLEKDVVLDVALRVAKLAQEKMGVEVVLTRSEDNFVPLHERTAIANNHKADLFLSIHANSSPAKEVAGTETFYLNFTNSPNAIDVAARENAGSEKTVGELRDVIREITLNDKIEESQTFANRIQTSLQAQAVKGNPAAHDRGVKRAPFVVLIGAQMPSVLAEIGFLTNPKDEANLAKPEYRQKVAEALYKGLAEYARSLSHVEELKVARAERTSGKSTGVQH